VAIELLESRTGTSALHVLAAIVPLGRKINKTFLLPIANCRFPIDVRIREMLDQLAIGNPQFG
jgi:hypothetical protein